MLDEKVNAVNITLKEPSNPGGKLFLVALGDIVKPDGSKKNIFFQGRLSGKLRYSSLGDPPGDFHLK